MSRGARECRGTRLKQKRQNGKAEGADEERRVGEEEAEERLAVEAAAAAVGEAAGQERRQGRRISRDLPESDEVGVRDAGGARDERDRGVDAAEVVDQSAHISSASLHEPAIYI